MNNLSEQSDKTDVGMNDTKIVKTNYMARKARSSLLNLQNDEVKEYAYEGRQKIIHSTVGCRLKRDFKRFSKNISDYDFQQLITTPAAEENDDDAPTFRFGNRIHCQSAVDDPSCCDNDIILQAQSSSAFWEAFEKVSTKT